MSRRTENEARREAFSLVPETCPEIDAAFDAVDAAIAGSEDAAFFGNHLRSLRALVKSAGTERLREALIRACLECVELRERVEELEGDVSDLSDELTEARMAAE